MVWCRLLSTNVGRRRCVVVVACTCLARRSSFLLSLLPLPCLSCQQFKGLKDWPFTFFSLLPIGDVCGIRLERPVFWKIHFGGFDFRAFEGFSDIFGPWAYRTKGHSQSNQRPIALKLFFFGDNSEDQIPRIIFFRLFGLFWPLGLWPCVQKPIRHARIFNFFEAQPRITAKKRHETWLSLL